MATYEQPPQYDQHGADFLSSEMLGQFSQQASTLNDLASPVLPDPQDHQATHRASASAVSSSQPFEAEVPTPPPYEAPALDDVFGDLRPGSPD